MLPRLWMGAALLGLLAGGASATQSAVLAEAHARGAAVDWTVLTPYARAVLTVSTPEGEVVRSEVGLGSAPTFSAFDEDGEARPDGAYNWELWLDPILAPEVQRRLAAAHLRGDETALRKIRHAHGLDRELVQSGTVRLVAGAFVVGGGPEPEPQAPAAKLGSVSGANQVIADDLIVQGNECVGIDCVANESFGFDTIRLKENNLRIHFDDTSIVAGFPANDWRLVANDQVSGGANKFSIEDSTGAKTPFTITAGAANHSIFVDSTGRVGLGTSTPAQRLHIKHGSPFIRLEATGPPAQTWDIRNASGYLAVADVTGGSYPFSIGSGAPQGSVHVEGSGEVGIGTFFPEARLHVFGASTTDTFVGIGPNPDGDLADQSALNVGYGGASLGRGVGFLNVRPDSGAAAPNPSLRFLVANTERMILDNEGFLGLGVANPANPIQHSNGAVLTAGGTWQSASSRATKRDIRTLEVADALAALQGLDPVRFYYKAEPGDEYLGFVAEDVPDLVATADHQRLGPLDIVAVLTKVVQQQQAAMTEQQAVINRQLTAMDQQQTAMSRQQATIDELASRLAAVERRQPQP